MQVKGLMRSGLNTTSPHQNLQNPVSDLGAPLDVRQSDSPLQHNGLKLLGVDAKHLENGGGNLGGGHQSAVDLTLGDVRPCDDESHVSVVLVDATVFSTLALPCYSLRACIDCPGNDLDDDVGGTGVGEGVRKAVGDEFLSVECLGDTEEGCVGHEGGGCGSGLGRVGEVDEGTVVGGGVGGDGAGAECGVDLVGDEVVWDEFAEGVVDGTLGAREQGQGGRGHMG